MRRPRIRLWQIYLAAGVLVTAVYFALPPRPWQNLLYDAMSAAAVIAILVGVRRFKPERRVPWYLIAVAQACSTLGELVYDWYEFHRHAAPPIPSMADGGFLIAYPFLAAGIVLIARSRDPRRDRGTVLDATIVATGLGMLSWVFLIQPTFRDNSISLAGQLTSVAYPVMDVLILFVLLRLVFGPGGRSPAFLLLALTMASTLTADAAYAVTSAYGGYVDGAWIDAGWLMAFVLMGTAALHPSMRAVAEPQGEYRPRLTPARLVLLTLASLAAPAALAIDVARGHYDSVPAVVAGSSVLFVLVVVRMAGLIHEVESKVDELDATGVELRQAEARYRTVVEHIPAVTFIQDVNPWEPSDWTTFYVSPQVETMFGYTPEEWMRDQPWQGMVEPSDLARIAEADQRRFETGDPLREEYRVRSRDGKLLWIHSEAVMVGTTRSGRQVWQGVMFDVTGHKLAEEALRNALGREREAAQRLRALDEMKNTFLHAVSHELRTPLAAILGAALTLDREDLELSVSDSRDLVRRTASNARKLDRLLADLLDLDRLDRGIIEPQRRPTDLGMLARRLVAESEIMGDRPIVVDAAPLEVDVDAAKVERILENLLANTARHTPPGTHVWVRVCPEEDGVQIAVEDDGPGVPPEIRATIFEAFRQGPAPEKHSPGVGIGLSLVAKFAALHGGTAWVQEREGGGASFRVHLPGHVTGDLRSEPVPAASRLSA